MIFIQSNSFIALIESNKITVIDFPNGVYTGYDYFLYTLKCNQL